MWREMNKPNNDFFWSKGVKEFFVNIEDGDIISGVTKKTGMNYCHIFNLIKKLELMSFLKKSEKIGRSRDLFLTYKGRRMKQLFMEMQKTILMNGVENGDRLQGQNRDKQETN